MVVVLEGRISTAPPGMVVCAGEESQVVFTSTLIAPPIDGARSASINARDLAILHPARCALMATYLALVGNGMRRVWACLGFGVVCDAREPKGCARESLQVRFPLD